MPLTLTLSWNYPAGFSPDEAGLYAAILLRMSYMSEAFRDKSLVDSRKLSVRLIPLPKLSEGVRHPTQAIAGSPPKNKV
jgi:hypothetical protein